MLVRLHVLVLVLVVILLTTPVVIVVVVVFLVIVVVVVVVILVVIAVVVVAVSIFPPLLPGFGGVLVLVQVDVLDCEGELGDQHTGQFLVLVEVIGELLLVLLQFQHLVRLLDFLYLLGLPEFDFLREPVTPLEALLVGLHVALVHDADGQQVLCVFYVGENEGEQQVLPDETHVLLHLLHEVPLGLHADVLVLLLPLGRRLQHETDLAAPVEGLVLPLGADVTLDDLHRGDLHPGRGQLFPLLAHLQGETCLAEAAQVGHVLERVGEDGQVGTEPVELREGVEFAHGLQTVGEVAALLVVVAVALLQPHVELNRGELSVLEGLIVDNAKEFVVGDPLSDDLAVDDGVEFAHECDLLVG